MPLLTAIATKETQESKLGVAFTRAGVESPLVIKLIRDESLFKSSALRAGMIVEEIQGMPMTWKTPKDAADILRSAPAGEVTITSPTFVGTITKESKGAKLGISLKNSTKSHGIFISKVSEEGAFADSELATGQQVLLINDTPCPATTKEAITLVKEAEGELTVLTIPTDLVAPEEESAPAPVPVPEAAPVADEKKDETPEGDDSEEKERVTPEDPSESATEEEDKGIIDKIFATCIC